MYMNKIQWFVAGDIDGFFGLMIDNLIQLLVLIGLCMGVCGFPGEFVYAVVLPGVAISLVVGNLFYAYQAYKLAQAENRSDVTALPYGINTVSLFAFLFFVMLPVYISTKDYKMAWKIGLLASFLSGLIEFFGAFVAETIRRVTPRAALLSALAGIAITFISMDFLVRTYQRPIIAFIPLGIILLQYFGKVKFPFRIPGGLVSVIAGTLLAWSAGLWDKPMMNAGEVSKSASLLGFYLPTFALFDFFPSLFDGSAKAYISIILPMGLFNVIGSLQNIESAEAAGDRFETRSSLMVNGLGTILGACFGSPFPTTIYIGHPGWKGLGARAGYSVLNAAFMTVVCLFGLMAFVKAVIPIEAGMAIILWIGFIIGSQAFAASPKEHAPAVVIGLFPALAGWAILLIQSVFNYAQGYVNQALSKAGSSETIALTLEKAPLDVPFLPYTLGGLISLSQGFLLTSMVWGAIAVFIIERDFRKSSYWSFAGAMLAALGLIHSFSLQGNAILNNYSIPASKDFLVAYLLLAVLFFLFGIKQKNQNAEDV
ncbi:MAG: NCS2 family permease [Spirochaetota bacterium]